MTKLKISGRNSVGTVGLRGIAAICVLYMFAVAARGQQKPCCTITVVDSRSAVATARVNATAQQFQFKVTPALATSLRPGQGVYANFSSRQVSLDGKTVCCTIIAVSPSPTVPAPAGRPTTPAPATEGQRSPVAQAASSTGSGSGTSPRSYHLPTPSSVTFAPDSLTGGADSTATITLTEAAPQGGLAITLASNQPNVVSVPQKITVPGGSASTNVALPTQPVPLKSGNDDPTPVVISASGTPSRLATTSQVVTQTGTLYVVPPIVKSLGGFSKEGSVVIAGRCAATPFSHTGGYSLDGCVLLNGPAADESQIKPALDSQTTPSTSLGELHAQGARVSLSSSNPQIASVPATTVVPVGKDQGSFHILTVPVQTATTVEISAHRTNSDTKSAQLTVLPPTLEGFQCDPAAVTGGESLPCTLTLSGPAYAGMVVSLQFSSTQGLVNPVTSVTFQQGKSTALFGFVTTPVQADVSIGVTASFGGVNKSLTLQIRAPRPKTIGLNPSNPIGGNPTTGTVTLTGDAPNNGIDIALSSHKPSIAALPAVVHIAGQPGYQINKAQFPITTQIVTSNTDVTISASFSGTTAQGTLTVRAAPKAALVIQSYVFTVNGQAVMVNDLQAGKAFTMCPIIANMGQAASSSTTLNVTLSKSDGSTVQTWSPTVPGLNPNTTTGTSDVCIDVPALASGYTYDLNGSFGSAGSFFMLQLSF